MLAWARETGQANYDLTVFQDLHYQAIDHLLETQPPENQALLCLLGDNFHSNDESQLTPRSGHKLDVDGRFAKVIRTGFTTFAGMAARVARHHGPRRTGVIALCGNHDPSAGLALCEYLRVATPRGVTVYDNANPYIALTFGRTMIGGHHGDGARGAKLAGVFAADFASQWGAASARWIFHGHTHCHSVVEAGGAKIESFATLAPRDYYSQHGGWRSERAATAITLDAKRGEIARYRFAV